MDTKGHITLFYFDVRNHLLQDQDITNHT